MIGVPMSEPSEPMLVIVNVPPWSSSGWRALLRARVARSPAALARPTRFFSPALRITGATSPVVPSATAMPMWKLFLTRICVPSTEAFMSGCVRSASTPAWTKYGV